MKILFDTDIGSDIDDALALLLLLHLPDIELVGVTTVYGKVGIRAKVARKILDAAQIVFDSEMPMQILTNDVTTRLWWDGAPVQQLIQSESPPENRIVGKLLEVWLDYRTDIFCQEITGTCPHDPLTIAEAVGHSFVTYASGQMTAHRNAGTTFVPSPEGKHHAGIDIDHDRFLAWLSRNIS